MKKTKGKVLAISLAVILCLAILPLSTLAGEGSTSLYTVTGTETTYSGEQQGLQVEVADGVTLYYSETGAEGSFTTEPITKKDAGQYTIYLKAEKDGVSEEPAPYQLNIGKAPASIQLGKQVGTYTYFNREYPLYDYQPVYGEAEPEVSVEVSGAVGGETLDVSVTRIPSEFTSDNMLTLKAGSGKTTVSFKRGSEVNKNYDITLLNASGGAVNSTSTYVTTSWRTRDMDYSAIAQNRSITYGDAVPDISALLSPANIGNILEADRERIPYAINQNPQYLITSLPTAYNPETGRWTMSWQQGSGTDISLLAPDSGAENRLGYGVYYYQFNLNNSTGPNFSGTETVKQNMRYTAASAGSYYLSIAQKPVTITADDQTMVYGDKDPALTGGNTETAYGESLDYSFTREAGERVGSYAINPVVDPAAYPNYKITSAAGTLTITPRALTLVGGSETVDYNAGTQTTNSYTVRGLAEGDRLVAGVSYSASGRNVGTEPGVFSVDEAALKIVNAEGEDVTDCYTSAQTTGALTINPIPATVYVDSFDKTSAMPDPDFSGRVEGLLADDTLGHVNYHREDETVDAAEAGSWPLTASYGENANYTVTLVPGTLNVTAAPVIVPVIDTVDGPGPAVFTPLGPVDPTDPVDPAAPIVADEILQNPNQPTANLEGQDTPQAAVSGHWALLNLILPVFALLMAVILFAGVFSRRKSEEGAQDEAGRGEENERTYGRNGLLWRLLAILAGVFSPIAFLLTENIRLAMTFVDGWTLLMVILLAAQLVFMLILRKVRQPRERDDEQAPPLRA